MAGAPNGRYFDGQTAAAHAVSCSLTGMTLRLTTANHGVIRTWRVADMKSRGAPDARGELTLSCRNDAGRLTLADKDLIIQLRAAGLPIPRQETRVTASSWMWLLGAALVIGIGLFLVLTEILPGIAARNVPFAWEDAIGRETVDALSASRRVCKNQPGQAVLEHLAAQLGAAAGLSHSVDIRVLDTKTVNALAAPGGHIIVFRPLLKVTTDSAELAGVLAHEIAHVANHDTTTAVIRSMGISFVFSALGGDGAGRIAAGWGHRLTTLSYSRRAEARADADGIRHLQTAGFRADGLHRLFSRFHQHSHDDLEITWLENHPSDADRAAAATRDTEGDMPLTPDEWKALQAICDPP